MPRNYWKRVASGKYVDLGNLKVDDIELGDIETSLNQITRFTGHWKDQQPLTVAQHSNLCYNLAVMMEPHEVELHKAVLAHDFAESYIGDVATPVKKAMGSFWYDFAEPIEKTVELAVFGYNLSEDMHEWVKIYDLAALDIERRIMWSSQYGKDKWPMNPLNIGTLSTKQELFNSVKDKYIELEEMWKDLNET